MPINDPLNDGSDSEADGRYLGKAYDARPGTGNFESSVNRVVSMATRAVDVPGVVDDGLSWYGNVHDAIRKDIGMFGNGLSVHHGAGIVAAVSPNMDFESNNIHALSELAGMTPEHWGIVAASANQPGIPFIDKSGRRGRKVAPRTAEAASMLSEVAPSVSTAPDSNLMKAHAIIHGADFNDVLNRRTAPKTNSFAHDLADPSHTSHGFVTIDGRQADIIANRMRPWTWSNRGISSAALPTGGQTRYEDHEAVMHAATSRLARRHEAFRNATPADVQAVTWLMGQHVERMPPTVSGEPRQKGVSRRGQPYILGNGRLNNRVQTEFIDHR